MGLRFNGPAIQATHGYGKGQTIFERDDFTLIAPLLHRERLLLFGERDLWEVNLGQITLGAPSQR